MESLLEEKDTNFYTGLLLALQSTVFIGSSFVIQKKALIKLNRSGSTRASAGGFGYLKEWLWWLGLITMGIGEAANFAAYAFAPASLVTPLGALSILVSTVLASKYLNEKLNILGKLGCLLCIFGALILILFSPKQEEVGSLKELIEKFHESYFIYYVCFVAVLVLLIGCFVGPKYGNKHVIIYISLCSAVGSLTVMACKALGLAVKEFSSLSSPASSSEARSTNICLMALLVVFAAICITIQMNYLNKALDLFNTNIVTPIFYVFFTTLVLIASAVLFQEWKHLSLKNALGCLGGFFVVIVAIFFLTTFKSVDFNAHDLSLFTINGKPAKQEQHKSNCKLKCGAFYINNV